MISRLPRFRDTSAIEKRLQLMYRGTVFGMRMWLAYGLGCHRPTVTQYIADNSHLYPFVSIQGKRCSTSYYDRQALSWYERDRREIEAREQRGEQFNRFFRRQA